MRNAYTFTLTFTHSHTMSVYMNHVNRDGVDYKVSLLFAYIYLYIYWCSVKSSNVLTFTQYLCAQHLRICVRTHPRHGVQIIYIYIVLIYNTTIMYNTRNSRRGAFLYYYLRCSFSRVTHPLVSRWPDVV